MNKRENIFSRLNLNNKNLDTELEEILDEKKFTEDAQSLILSMFYKIENAYKDYYKVKRQMPVKEVFIQAIIDIIKKYCNEIEIIKPKGTKNEKSYKINKENGSIRCFANEDILLLGLCELIKINSETDDLLEQAISEILEYGNSLNYQEVIRAFNGWSWQDTLSLTYDLQCNLIYQNLLIILGNEKLQEIIMSKEKISKIEKELKKHYNSELTKKIIFYLLKISVTMKANKNKEYKLELENYFEPQIQELEKLENKEELISFIANKRRDITNQIGEIDKKLNDIKYLRVDFEERNKKLAKDKKIFSLSSLAEVYEEKREKLLESMKEYNRLIEPKRYLKKKEELQEKTDFYKSLNLKQDKKTSIEKDIMEFQVVFLECFKEKIDKCQDKKEIINLIYYFRYYWLLNYKKDYKIKNSIKLKEYLKQILTNIVVKAEKLNALEKFTNDNVFNVKIVENVLTNEIINLENVILQFLNFNENKEKYKVQYYDGVMLTSEIEMELKGVINIKKKLRMLL